MFFLRWLAVVCVCGFRLGAVHAGFIHKIGPIPLTQPVFIAPIRPVQNPNDREHNANPLPAVQLLYALEHEPNSTPAGCPVLRFSQLRVGNHHRSFPEPEAEAPPQVAQAEVIWLKISGRLTYKGVPLTSRRAASTHSMPEHMRPVRVLGSMIQTVSTPISR